MESKKILLTGGGGLLGTKIKSLLGPIHKIRSPGHSALSIGGPKGPKSYSKRFDPDVIINCAAITNVDACETKSWTRSSKVNGVGPANLVNAFPNAKIIHISTDYVFSGENTPGTGYTEEHACGPIQRYGMSKLHGEMNLKVNCGENQDYIVLRVSTLYGYNQLNNKKTLVNWILGADENTPLYLYDQVTNNTLIDDIVTVIGSILATDRGWNNIYNCVGSNPMTRYDFAKEIARVFDIKRNIILKPLETATFEAKRPKNCTLNTTKLVNEYGTWMKSPQEGLRLMKEQMMVGGTFEPRRRT